MAIQKQNRADLLQVLVLTHEQEPMPSMQAYAAVRLWPAQPVLLYGRSAAETPVCNKSTAVFHGWKDRLEQHNCDRAFDLGGTSICPLSGTSRDQFPHLSIAEQSFDMSCLFGPCSWRSNTWMLISAPVMLQTPSPQIPLSGFIHCEPFAQ